MIFKQAFKDGLVMAARGLFIFLVGAIVLGALGYAINEVWCANPFIVIGVGGVVTVVLAFAGIYALVKDQKYKRDLKKTRKEADASRTGTGRSRSYGAGTGFAPPDSGGW